MRYASQMLLIGSAGRNSGKTTLACRLIEKLRRRHRLVAAKVTAIQARDGLCPRGGTGCGTCASLEGQYDLLEEQTPGAAKDTQRLLAAGADRVYWLRVMRDCLDEGAKALLEAVGSAPLICESNSLRTVVEPALFLMCRHGQVETVKATARVVWAHADAHVAFDGRAFDFDLRNLGLHNKRWTLRYPAAAIILAGGKSERMGQDKTLMTVRGLPMIACVASQLRPHFDQLLISANDTAKFAFLEVTVVADKATGQGPLMGIVSALEASPHDANLVVACDVPYIDMRLVRRLLRDLGPNDVAAPVAADGGVEPLFAAYRKSALRPLKAALAAGECSVRKALKQCRVVPVDTDLGKPLVNLNTPEDYGAFLSGATHED